MTYIVDTSGSMEGVSIAQAREALLMALDRLQPGDRFNVIEFNSVTRLAVRGAAAGRRRDDRARAAVRVAACARAAARRCCPRSRSRWRGAREAAMMRQVVFLTDGAVGNEDEILRFVGDAIGDRRLFTVGIGPAPNSFFMTKAAQFGRGTYTYIGDVREVKEKMTALFRKLETPALTDIAVDWPAGADVWPRVAARPLRGRARGGHRAVQRRRGAATSRCRGRRDGDDVGHRCCPPSPTCNEPGVGVLWARAKIDALMDAARRGAPEADVRAAVLDVALTHHLVSKYTSLVAVDVTPTRPAQAPCRCQNRAARQHSRRAHRLRPAPAHRHARAAAARDRRGHAPARRGLALRLRAGSAVALAALRRSRCRTRRRGGAGPRKVAPPRNLLLLPGHYDGDVGSMDATIEDMPEHGWFVLVKDAAGSYLRRIPDSGGARPLFLRELELASLDNSATLQSALGQLYYLNLPRTALREGPLTEVPLRRRALIARQRPGVSRSRSVTRRSRSP